MRKTMSIALAVVALLLTASSSLAQSKEELQERFEKRLGEIRQLKQAGTVGETSEGYLDFVEGRSAKAGAVVDDENADRKALYRLIAKETGTTPAKVAERAGKRNFERARAGEYLKEGGKWKKKA